jgi:hypothetical protein
VAAFAFRRRNIAFVLHAFQPSATRRKRSSRARPSDVGDEPARVFWCAACRTRVAREDAVIDVGGAHRHRCTNPAGVEFEIGCFREAPGCRVDGEATLEFSWFSGYAWSFANCTNCRTHLGWCYEGEAGRFFGLIFARLLGPV